MIFHIRGLNTSYLPYHLNASANENITQCSDIFHVLMWSISVAHRWALVSVSLGFLFETKLRTCMHMCIYLVAVWWYTQQPKPLEPSLTDSHGYHRCAYLHKASYWPRKTTWDWAQWIQPWGGRATTLPARIQAKKRGVHGETGYEQVWQGL